jgi:hypothetical protein
VALGPPAGALTVKRLTWRKGAMIHRFHSQERRANAFNPCQGRPGRFNPLIDAAGHCIPTLYGADSLRCAAFESVFHDAPFPSPAEVARAHVLRFAYSTLAPMRSLKLGDLTSEGLRHLGIRRRDLLESLPEAYPITVQWAQALHRQCNDLDGLLWLSRLFDRGRSIVLFGDRVDERDLEMVTGPAALAADHEIYDVVAGVGARAGIVIVED